MDRERIKINTPGRDPACYSCKHQRRDLLPLSFVVSPCKILQQENQDGVIFDPKILSYKCASYQQKASLVISHYKTRLVRAINSFI